MCSSDPSCVSSRVLGRPGPGPDRLGLKCYLAWGEPGWWWGGKGFCHTKKVFFQKKCCREGAYLRGSVTNKSTFSKKSVDAEVPI